MGSGQRPALARDLPCRVRGPRRPRLYMVPGRHHPKEEAAMSVLRFEPFRDPFRELDRLIATAASGKRAPLGMPMDVYRGEDGSYHVEAERPQGSFARQLSLGEGVDSEHLTAGYADGVLHVTIPASPKTQARRVEITHAPAGSTGGAG